MSQLLIDRQELSLGPDGLEPEEEARLLWALGRLSTALSRAVPKVGAAQPAAWENAVAELFPALAALEGYFDEITYLAATEAERPDIDVEGVFASPVALSACLEHAAQHEAAGELLEFLHGRHLVSLTIRRASTKAPARRR